jgi:hypothetical protein
MELPYYKVIDDLYMAGAGSINAIDQLRLDGIRSVLKLYDGEPEWPSDFAVCDNAINDGVFIPKDVLDYGVTFVRDAIETDRPVLVVCGLGISRSATFVLAYLVESATISIALLKSFARRGRRPGQCARFGTHSSHTTTSPTPSTKSKPGDGNALSDDGDEQALVVADADLGLCAGAVDDHVDNAAGRRSGWG